MLQIDRKRLVQCYLESAWGLAVAGCGNSDGLSDQSMEIVAVGLFGGEVMLTKMTFFLGVPAFNRILGCTAYVHVPEEKRIKLDSHALKGQLIGYGGTNQWKVWVPERNEVVTSRDVVFDEEEGEKLMAEVPAAAAI